MKKFKISIVAILAIVISIGLSSFTLFQKPSSQKWFTLTGSDMTAASSYSVAPGNGADPQCPTVPGDVCAIYANDDGNGNPVQSELDAIRSESSQFTVDHPNLEYEP